MNDENIQPTIQDNDEYEPIIISNAARQALQDALQQTLHNMAAEWPFNISLRC